MKIVNRIKKLLTGTALAAAALTSAHAAPTTVGGVTWDPDSLLDFSSFSLAIRQTIDPTSGVVSGYGVISTMNGTAQNAFCPGCELTFTFGNFTPISSNPIPSTSNSTVVYTGGFVNVYVDTTPEVTNPSDPTTLSLANTGDGTLWLGLVGHPQGSNNATLTGTVAQTALSGVGTLDVVSGLAAANFDTNTLDGGADLSFSNSFTLFFSSILNAAGTGNFYGDSTNNVPEPASLSLVGLALLGVGAARRRKPAK